jgi:hypothetical protein
MATVGAPGAVTFQLIANILPARAADNIRVRGMIVSLDRSMPKVEASRRRDHHRGKLTGVAKAALDDVKPCKSVGVARAPTVAEAARSKS